MSSPRSGPSPGWRLLRIGVVIGLLGVASTLLIVAVGTQRTEDQPVVDLPTAVTAVHPEPGEVGFRQDAVGADLRSEFTGTLAIDGRDIPLDQLTSQEVGNVRYISFQPSDGLVIEQLEPGAHTATVYWWPTTDEAPARYDESVKSFSWSFTAG